MSVQMTGGDATPGPTGTAGVMRPAGSESVVKLSITDAQNLIPEYDGNPQDLHKFISCCDLLFSGERTEAETNLYLNILKTKLNGAAYDIFKFSTLNSWEGLKAALTDQFCESRPRAVLQCILMRCKQGPREDLRDYVQRIFKTLADLNGATLKEYEGTSALDLLIKENEQNALRVFEDGIKNDQLRLITKARNESSLRKLTNYALEHASRIGDNTTLASTNFKPSYRPNFIFCTFCKQAGHSEESCFRKKNLPRFPSNPPVKLEVNKITCAYCRKPNHHIRDCRNRLYNEQRSRHQVTDSPQRQSHFNQGIRNVPPRNNSPTPRPIGQIRQVRWISDSGNEEQRERDNGIFTRSTTTAVIHAEPTQ